MLDDFIAHFTREPIPWTRVGDRFFLMNPRLDRFRLKGRNPEIIGGYLGESIHEEFQPSFILLDVLNDMTDEKVLVNDRGEIDFLYGKHLRKRHVVDITGSQDPGGFKLVVNAHGEILGYGKFIGVSEKRAQILRHIIDRGIFIKRDKQQI